MDEITMNQHEADYLIMKMDLISKDCEQSIHIVDVFSQFIIDSTESVDPRFSEFAKILVADYNLEELTTDNVRKAIQSAAKDILGMYDDKKKPSLTVIEGGKND